MRALPLTLSLCVLPVVAGAQTAPQSAAPQAQQAPAAPPQAPATTPQDPSKPVTPPAVQQSLSASAVSEGRVITLAEAETAAREHQPSLRSAQASTDAAYARVDQAFSSFLPQVSASASYTLGTSNRAVIQNVPGSDTGVVSNSTRRFSGGLAANQLIYDFGRTSGRYNASKENAGAQEDSQQQVLQDALRDVRSAYFNVLTQKALLGVARETLQSEEARLNQVNASVQVGSRPEIDLLQQRTAKANAQVALIRAQNTYATAKAQLNQTMGVETSTDYTVQDVTVAAIAGEDEVLDALVKRALEARPDVAARERQIAAQESQVKVTKGGHWPSLSATGSLSDVGENPFNGATLSAQGGVQLSWALFQGGLVNAQTREANANLRDLQAQKDALRQQVRLQVEQARLNVVATREALTAADEAQVNARERLRLAEGRYRAGVGNIIEVSDAQVAFTNAAAQQVQATYDLATSRAELARALGTVELSTVASR
ncbi:TolC family protein [Corallococcus carmarthensis]|uniref:TolC family protein n=1 Tax=Corallococcus carmarthensis TaxID=2316728 RepID=A0A3A8K533_9BACT|nr:TolC family protein [Corallococcus carmarthensis]NOK21548.1 TolC family protein [Corallococcus carmarthensis]RKG97551.1 TolC family protein [Corallococcus carmarthensis]